MGALATVVLLVFWPNGMRTRTRDEVLADTRKVLAGFVCSRIAIEDFNEKTGEVSLAGNVESTEQQAQIREAVLGLAEVTSVYANLRTVPRPFCAAIDLLEPFRLRSIDAGSRLTVRPQNGCDVAYHAGETLVVDVSTQQGLRYIYVDYFDADRENAAHLLPNPRQRENFLEDLQHHIIGGPGSEVQWQVEPPFGLELITAIASPSPLFPNGRPADEGALSYIDDLGAALARNDSNAQVVANYCLITTSE